MPANDANPRGRKSRPIDASTPLARGRASFERNDWDDAFHGGQPLIRVKPGDLSSASVERVSRVVGARTGRPVLEGGETLDVTNVIWCSGFSSGFDWIDLPIFDDDGRPRHRGGVVESASGLYFVGLAFLYAMSSSMIHGVSRDAERVATVLAARVHSTAPSGPGAQA